MTGADTLQAWCLPCHTGLALCGLPPWVLCDLEQRISFTQPPPGKIEIAAHTRRISVVIQPVSPKAFWKVSQELIISCPE